MYVTKEERGYEATNKHEVRLTTNEIWCVIDEIGPVAKDLKSGHPLRKAYMVLVGQVTGNA